MYLVTRNWEDMLRLPGSLKLGRIHAGATMGVLQVKDRPTTLALGLAELGRFIKTLHILGYIDSKEKRRRILTQLNRQEFRHRLTRRVCRGDRGEISDADIARVSPLLSKHINFLGRYAFDLPQTFAQGALRPLATLIPNRTSAQVYDSTPYLSDARAK